jgi:hypothetical protein
MPLYRESHYGMILNCKMDNTIDIFTSENEVYLNDGKDKDRKIWEWCNKTMMNDTIGRPRNMTIKCSV